MWEKPSYEVIDVCAEVTAYVYKDAKEDRHDMVGEATIPVYEGKITLKSEETSA